MRALYGRTTSMSISETIARVGEKQKHFLNQHKQEMVLALIIFLVSSVSFGLGYLIAQQNNRAPIIIEKHPQE